MPTAWRLASWMRLEAGKLDAYSLEAGRLDAYSLEADRLDAYRLDAYSLEAGRPDAYSLEAGRLEACSLSAFFCFCLNTNLLLGVCLYPMSTNRSRKYQDELLWVVAQRLLSPTGWSWMEAGKLDAYSLEAGCLQVGCLQPGG